METTQNVKRKYFAGKTKFIIDYSTPEKLEASKKERHFYQRMLRAYLKGADVFQFGRDPMTNKPVQYKVLIEWR